MTKEVKLLSHRASRCPILPRMQQEDTLFFLIHTESNFTLISRRLGSRLKASYKLLLSRLVFVLDCLRRQV